MTTSTRSNLKKIVFWLGLAGSIATLASCFFPSGNTNNNFEQKNENQQIQNNNQQIIINNNTENHTSNVNTSNLSIQLQMLNGAPGKEISVKIGKKTYVSDENGLILLEHGDHISGVINFTNNKYYIVQQPLNLNNMKDVIIIDTMPDYIIILEPQNSDEIVAFEERPLVIRYNFAGKEYNSNTALDAKLRTRFYSDGKLQHKISTTKTENSGVFKINFDKTCYGELHIDPYVEFETGHTIKSKERATVFLFKNVSLENLERDIVLPSPATKKKFKDHVLTLRPTANNPITACVLPKAKISEKHAIELDFFLFGNSSYVAINISGMRFEFAKFSDKIECKPTMPELFREFKDVDRRRTMSSKVDSNKRNTLRISSYTKDKKLHFVVDPTFNGERRTEIKYSFDVDSDSLKKHLTIDLECGTRNKTIGDSVLIQRVIAY